MGGRRGRGGWVMENQMQIKKKKKPHGNCEHMGTDEDYVGLMQGRGLNNCQYRSERYEVNFN